MKCPFCQTEESKVLDSRESDSFIRRRRECLSCEKRFTTYERIESAPITVIKKDGKRESFDRDKILKGVLIACQKRPISREKIESLVDSVESSVRKRDQTEVSSNVIGGIVTRKLKALDKVAYIRFASVYREFADIISFESELKKLKH